MRAAHLPEPLQVECIVELGKPAEIIAGWCGDDRRCLIAMATNGVAGARRWFLGSVTGRVAQTATQPILLVRPSDQAPANPALKTIIIGLDGSELAERVLPYAKAFAKKLNLAVLLLRAFEIPIDALLMRGADCPQRFAERKAGLQKKAQDYLEVKARQLRDDGIAPVAATILEGSPASALIESAEQHDGSLVAMATHGRSGLNRWMMGSVAEKVVHHAGAPVLLVRAG